MAQEQEYTNINIYTETKELFEQERKKVPYEHAETQDTFLKYLIQFHQQNKTRKINND